MDDLDRAQDIEMASRNAAIASQRDKQGHTSLSHCQDCGDAIPALRLKIGGISRCIDCQHDFERSSRARKQ